MKNSQPIKKNSKIPVMISDAFSFKPNWEAIWMDPCCINTRNADTKIIDSRSVEFVGSWEYTTRQQNMGSQNDSTNGTKTGDAMPIGMLAVLMLAATAGIAFCGRKLYKSR